MDWNTVLNILYSIVTALVAWLWWFILLLTTPGGWITLIGFFVLIAILRRKVLPEKAREKFDEYSVATLWRSTRYWRWKTGHWLLEDYDWSKDSRGIAVKTVTEKVDVPVRIRRSFGEWLSSTALKIALGVALLFVAERWDWIGPYFWKLFGY